MREKEEDKSYVGRMRETEQIKRNGKPLTQEERQHNLDWLKRFTDRPKITRNKEV